MDPLLKNLTEPQRQAVLHVDGPLLILAGPGSGKTRVITHRIAHLLRTGVPAGQILALTFTNKAAEEMKTRVAVLAPDRPVWISTFHRFCSRLLREYAAMVGLGPNFTIYDTGDSQSALKRAIEGLDFDSTHYTPQRIAGAISTAKNNLVGPAEYEARSGSPLASIVARVYPAYQAELLRSNAVDFDDLLLHTAMLLRDNPEVRASLDAKYRYVMVDEYQDTNLAQYTIVHALSIDQPNLAVTGDPDQSIYGWRGANLSNILEFEHDYPEVQIVRLEQNYRSTKAILRVADRLIVNNRRRKHKDLFTENDEGQPVALTTYGTQKDEADAIAERIAALVNSGKYQPRDIAIFYRVNALSRALEFALREHAIPYQIIRGVEFFQRKEIKDVLGYLQLLNNPRDNTAFLRVVNTPPRGIGKTTLERIAEHAARRRMTLLEAARECGLIETISKKAAVSVAKFVSFFDRLNLLAHEPVEAILGHVLEESGYHDLLKKSEDEDDHERLANIEELLTAAREFDERNPGAGALEAFLEQASLVNDTDDWDAVQDRVTMMTLHASKGLEFPVVFITAVEEGLIPHERSRDNPADLEEERRLLFVGLTRAEKELYLSRAVYRSFRGRAMMTVPSMFLIELPIDEMQVSESGVMALPSMAWLRDDGIHNEDDRGESFEAFDDADAMEFDPRKLEATEPAAAPAPSLGGLKTAAEMVAGGAAALPAVSPEEFFAGMLVRHPEYGLGKIVALSGQRANRKATVAFTSSAGQRTFVLAQSPLRPVK
ncbi:MAG TPA: UvrD-helicase domain-containing protein [Pirellulales bacterium]|nr:UvrD-helicase domain-containing protein [Pirellulales bacterium]